MKIKGDAVDAIAELKGFEFDVTDARRHIIVKLLKRLENVLVGSIDPR